MKKNYMVRTILGNNKYGRHHFDTFAEAKQFFDTCACERAILYAYSNWTRGYMEMGKR